MRMILVYISFCLPCVRKKLSVAVQTVHPDLNKNRYMWYDCKTHLNAENSCKINPADM